MWNTGNKTDSLFEKLYGCWLDIEKEKVRDIKSSL